MYRVIIVSRQYGGGDGVGWMLAQRLGWKLVDDSLFNKIAGWAQVNPEVAARPDETLDSSSIGLETAVEPILCAAGLRPSQS